MCIVQFSTLFIGFNAKLRSCRPPPPPLWFCGREGGSVATERANPLPLVSLAASRVSGRRHRLLLVSKFQKNGDKPSAIKRVNSMSPNSGQIRFSGLKKVPLRPRTEAGFLWCVVTPNKSKAVVATAVAASLIAFQRNLSFISRSLVPLFLLCVFASFFFFFRGGGEAEPRLGIESPRRLGSASSSQVQVV